MAGTTVARTSTALTGSCDREVRLQYNKLVDDVEALRLAFATAMTKLNADAGVTDTNYAGVLAATLTASKVSDNNGNTTT